MLRQIEQLAGYGLTLPKIAAVLNISERLLNKKKLNEERVRAALDRGRAVAEGIVGKSLFERAKDGDVAAIRWWEMTRANRHAAVAVEQTANVQVSGGVTVYLPENGR
jgi:hypothetical protein